MAKTLIIGALSALIASLPVQAAEQASVPPASVEERLAALEAEVAALREQLAPETFAKQIAEAMLEAQRKALEPPTPEEAVQKLAKAENLDAATQTAVIELLKSHKAEQDALMAKVRSGEIPREEVREQFTQMREKHQQALGEQLSEEQIQALQQAQRPPAAAGRGDWGRGGGFGGDRGRGDRGDRGGPPGNDEGQAGERQPGRADF